MSFIIKKYKEIRENPFPFPNPKSFVKSVLIGRDEQIKNLQYIFEEIHSQSSISIVTGFPGYGKTQFLNHLDYLFQKKKFGKNSIFCKIDDLPEEPLRGKDLEKLFLNKLKQERIIDQSVTSLSEEINNRKKRGELTIIVLAIDSVDEYFRYLDQTAKNPKILLSSLRMLFASVNVGLCVLLACTHDVAVSLKDMLSADRTYARRTKWVTPDLGALSFQQIKLIPEFYLREWMKYCRIKSTETDLFTDESLYAFYSTSEGSPGNFVRCCNRAINMMAQDNISVPLDFENAIFVVKSLVMDLNLNNDKLKEIEDSLEKYIVERNDIESKPSYLIESILEVFNKNGYQTIYKEENLLISNNTFAIGLKFIISKEENKKSKRISSKIAREIISFFSHNDVNEIILVYSSGILPEWEFRGGLNSAKKIIMNSSLKKKITFYKIERDDMITEEFINFIKTEFKQKADPLIKFSLENKKITEYEKSYIREALQNKDFETQEAEINLLYENRLRIYIKEKLKDNNPVNWFLEGISNSSIKNNLPKIKKRVKANIANENIIKEIFDPGKKIKDDIVNPFIYLTLGELREIINSNGKGKWDNLCDLRGIKHEVKSSMINIEKTRNSIKHGREPKSNLKERYLIEITTILELIHEIKNIEELTILINKCKSSPIFLSSD